MEEKELHELVTLLSNAGIEKEDADDLVIKAVKKSTKDDTSVMCALYKLADDGKKTEPDSKKHHLQIVLRKLRGSRELEKLTSLFAEL